MLTEEYSVTAGQAGGAAVAQISRVTSPPVHKSEHYGDAEFLGQQPRLIDLLPRQPIGFVLCLLGGLMAIMGLECLYAWMPELASLAVGGRLTAFDLAAPGSLGAWFSSLVLLAATVTALQIYTVRRHKMDDYHGRYRIWLWAAGCWFWLATDAAAGLHQGFQAVMTGVTGTGLLGDGAIWWVSAWFLLLAVIGSRLLVDMWTCRLSTASLISAWLCYTAAFCAHLGWLLPGGGPNHVLLRQGLQMGGDLLVLLAMGLHARFVLLDARGLLPRRAPESKGEETARRQARRGLKVVSNEENEADEQSEAQESAGDGQWRATGATKPEPQPAPRGVDPGTPVKLASPPAQAATTPAKPAPSPLGAKVSAATTGTSKDADADDSSGDPKLSKADRKALKKRLLEERLKREQRTAGKW
jgi:hypothetical protein